MQDNDEIEIDVSEIFHVLLNKIWVILLAGIIAALAVIAGTLLFITPQYESTTKMYVLSKQDSNTLTSQDKGLCGTDQEPYSYRRSYHSVKSGYDT